MPDSYFLIDGNGYAAGCAAGLRPAVVWERESWAMPLVRPLADQLGHSPDQGRSPNAWGDGDGRAEPCLTSGGIAETSRVSAAGGRSALAQPVSRSALAQPVSRSALAQPVAAAR
jgi:hypothetical protein